MNILESVGNLIDCLDVLLITSEAGVKPPEHLH